MCLFGLDYIMRKRSFCITHENNCDPSLLLAIAEAVLCIQGLKSVAMSVILESMQIIAAIHIL